MVGDRLKRKILDFIASLHGGKFGVQGFGYILKYNEEIANRIRTHYLPLANVRSEKIKERWSGLYSGQYAPYF